MALQLSQSKLKALAEKATRMQARASKLKEKSEKAIQTVVRTMEVSGAAFVFGGVQGYTYDSKTGQAGVEIMGIPLDLGFGVATHLLGFTVLGDATAEHAHALADGAMACSAATYGRSAGKKLKEKMAKGGLLGP